MAFPGLLFDDGPKAEPTTRAGVDAEVFVQKLGQALHAFGSPAHRLEAALQHVSRSLGLEGQFFCSPTAIFASFGADRVQRTTLFRVDPGDVHLEKLSRLDALVQRVVRGDLGLDEASRRVDEIVAATPRYGAILTTLSFALVSGGAARFFGGGWREIVAATVGGLLVGLWSLVAARVPDAGRLFEPVGGMIMAFATATLATMMMPMSPQLVTLSGLIVLVPGMTLTVAMTELATRNLVSGSARLAGAALVFITIGFGVALGSQLGVFLYGTGQSAEPVALPLWTEAVALLAVAFAFTVLFRARPRDVVWMLVAGVVAIGGARLGATVLGPELGALLAAFAVGIAGNAFARLCDRPSAIVQLPGLMLLVPGSIGFRGIASLLEQDVVSGVESAFAMALVAIALVTGLLMANVFLPPRRAL
ncbi:MAG: threonine/serine exporter family protein [Acidobacteriota bacterium]